MSLKENEMSDPHLSEQTIYLSPFHYNPENMKIRIHDGTKLEKISIAAYFF